MKAGKLNTADQSQSQLELSKFYKLLHSDKLKSLNKNERSKTSTSANLDSKEAERLD